jgi:trehalose 6-phosphate synthase/phosphatase
MFDVQNLGKEISEKYRRAISRLILLDYDGTLVWYRPKPDQAYPTEEVLDVLNKLILDKSNDVIIVTGRDHTDIDSLIGNLPIKIIASHGAIMKVEGKWIGMDTGDSEWKNVIRRLMEETSAVCPGTFIEEKIYTLAWHYRNTDELSGYESSRVLVDKLKAVADANDLKVLDGKMVLEVMPAWIGKGNAIRKILESASYDLILSFGDDVTDEEIFSLLASDSEAVTVKVGMSPTVAMYKVVSPEDVIELLKNLVT